MSDQLDPLSRFFARPSFMDVSPHPRAREAGACPATGCSTSTASTPLDLKRSRDEELEAYLAAGPPCKRMETTPCSTPMGSPQHPSAAGEAMAMATPAFMGTPLASHFCGGNAEASDLRIRFSSCARQGPRSCVHGPRTRLPAAPRAVHPRPPLTLLRARVKVHGGSQQARLRR